MQLNTSSDQARERDFVSEPWTDEGGLLSPTSNATMDSERRSLTSPSQRIVHRKWTDPDGRSGSRASLRSNISGANLSDAGVSTTASEKGKHGPLPQPSSAVSEFKEFIQACQNLEKYLESFTHQVQKLGSAFGLVKASRELHVSLTRVRLYFEENAQTLGLLLNKIKAAKSAKQAKKRKKRRGTIFARSDTASSISENSQGSFITALNFLARTVKKFTMAIMDFEDYSDEEGIKALQDFEIELRVLSGGLEFFSVDGESHELRRFVTARAGSLKVHLDNLSEALKRFEEIGIPCISFAQKRSSRMLLNAATVATFFAGVAATTLQYSVELTTKKREIAMNTLWFVSLVLSIGAAITGMLAITWRLAVFSSPKRELPLYIRFWIRSGYLVLLIASVVAFLAGLVIYVFDAMPWVSFWIVTACTVFCVLGLSIVSGLFLKERYSFSQVRDELRKELNPVSWSRLYEHAEEGWWAWLRFHLFEQLQEKRRRLVMHYTFDSTMQNYDKKSIGPHIKEVLRLCLPCLRKKMRRQMTQDTEAAMETGVDESKRPEPWTKSSKKPTPAAQRKTHGLKRRYSGGDGTTSLWYKYQVQRLGVCLSAPVSSRAVHLQFSPHGHWLVVCYKYECCVFRVEDSFEYHATLRHYRHNAKQVEWAPSGKRLITRTNTSVKVWTVDSQEGRFEYDTTVHFDDFKEVTDIQWLNNYEFLAIVDEWQFFRVNVAEDPPLKTKYDPEPENTLLEIYYLYTLPDSDLVMIAGARKIENLDEDKAIDCIIVYEMQPGEPDVRSHLTRSTRSTTDSWGTSRDYSEGRGTIVRRIPLLNELESLSFGSYLDKEAQRRRMVISYSDKPPELWVVTADNDRIHVSLERELVKRMEPGEKKDEEAEWGEVFLIGPSQSIAACAEDGMMYFWDIEQPSNEQFYRLKITTEDEEVEELPLISWLGPGTDRILPTMATAGKGFSLRIWAPLGSLTMDENDPVHGPMDDGLTPAARSNSNGPPLITPSDSGIGQAKVPPMHTPPLPTFALPELDTIGQPHATEALPGPISGLDEPHRATLGHTDMLNLHEEPVLDDKSSHLVADSQYCTSPESSAKEVDAGVEEMLTEQDGNGET